ncbi:MAG: MarR family winged helix-turn-helix transcriptional regulator [Acidimicrobiales bacterium]
MSVELSTADDGDLDLIKLWGEWKRVNEVVRGAIIADVTAALSIAEPDLNVLVHLRAAGGAMRQNALSLATGWDRTRLSHLLTRMEERRHVRRQKLSTGVNVEMTAKGKALLDIARTPLRTAIERHLLAPLGGTAAGSARLRSVLAALAKA